MKKKNKAPWIPPAILAVFGLGATYDFPSTPITDFPQSMVMPEDTVRKAWEAMGISNHDFCREEFYTWVNKEQVEELRSGKDFLNRFKSKEGKWSEFDEVIRSKRFAGHAAAQLLSQDRYLNKRFAWTNPWATYLGWENENYGDQLLKVKLKPNSIIAYINTFESGRHPFYDMKGDSVTVEYAQAHPELIAACYFVNYHEEKVKQTYPKGRNRNPTMRRYKPGFFHRITHRKRTIQEPFREFVLLNNDQIASWQYGSDEIKQDLTNFAKTLRSEYTDSRNEFSYIRDIASQYYSYWNQQNFVDHFNQIYGQAICFPNEMYIGKKGGEFRLFLNDLADQMDAVSKAQSAEIKSP